MKVEGIVVDPLADKGDLAAAPKVRGIRPNEPGRDVPNASFSNEKEETSRKSPLLEGDPWPMPGCPLTNVNDPLCNRHSRDEALGDPEPKYPNTDCDKILSALHTKLV